jgi:hypothetical protein
MRIQRTAVPAMAGAALLAALAAPAVAAMAAMAAMAAPGAPQAQASPATEATSPQKTELRLILDHGSDRDHLVIDDLGDLAVGESRDYTTEAGKAVTVTRVEDGWNLDVGGRNVHVTDVGSDADLAAGDAGWHARRIEIDTSDGKPGTKVEIEKGETQGGDQHVFVMRSGDDGPGKVRVIRRIGPGDADAYAFTSGDGDVPMPLVGVEGLIRRLEKNEKFAGLDDATRATVLEAIRESAPKPVWVGKDGAGGEGAARQIVIELRDPDDPAR